MIKSENHKDVLANAPDSLAGTRGAEKAQAILDHLEQTAVMSFYSWPCLSTLSSGLAHSGEQIEQGSRENENLRAGGSHGPPGYFDVEATLGVLLAPQGWVIEGLVPRLPVTHRLPDGL